MTFRGPDICPGLINGQNNSPVGVRDASTCADLSTDLLQGANASCGGARSWVGGLRLSGGPQNWVYKLDGQDHSVES